MSPRPRRKSSNALPVNLYSVNNGKSYRYKHPSTGKFHGMGSDKLRAIEAAKQLNSLLITQNDLVGNVLGYVSVTEHIQWMRENIIPDREYSKGTIELNEIRYRNLIGMFGEKSISEITTKEISDLLEAHTPRVSNQIRQVAVDIFNIAISRGLCNDNPAEYIIKRKQKKQRQRLTLEQYKAIHQAAPVWMQNAMDLALITLQRRQDIVLMKFSDIQDGYLYVVQQKTQKFDTGYLKIQLTDSLKEVINRCKDRVVSPYIIHRNPHRKLKRPDMKHWTQIKPEMVSRQFKAITDELDIFSKMREIQRPTFHEIRALGIKLYKDAGMNPQQLAGHSSEQMTSNYDSGHDEIRWIEVVAGLKIN